MHPIELSLVIPTYNEKQNIEPLVRELCAALGETSWEAIFVDDSTDGTDLAIETLARGDARLKVLHRPVNRDGLAGAVVDGLAHVGGLYVCVLDADLQHPPEYVPTLLAN